MDPKDERESERRPKDEGARQAASEATDEREEEGYDQPQSSAQKTPPIPEHLKHP